MSRDSALLSLVRVVSRKTLMTPEPKVIKKLTTTVYSSFAMLTGMQLDVFTPLRAGPMSAEQIAKAIGVEASARVRGFTRGVGEREKKTCGHVV
jgi:hypothetical protein